MSVHDLKIQYCSIYLGSDGPVIPVVLEIYRDKHFDSKSLTAYLISLKTLINTSQQNVWLKILPSSFIVLFAVLGHFR